MGITQSKAKRKWQSEHVVDYKFDYVSTEELRSKRFIWRMGYAGIYLAVLLKLFSFVADTIALVSLLMDQSLINPLNTASVKTSTFFGQEMSTKVTDALKWAYVAAYGASILIFLWDIHKTKKIIRENNIALSAANSLAYRYFSFKDYGYYCLFRHLESRLQRKDYVAFLCHYQLKGWKRLLFAESVKAVINANQLFNYFNEAIKIDLSFRTVAMAFVAISVLLFTYKLICTIFAALVYIPLNYDVGGDLEGYVCHKLDKRTESLLRDQREKFRSRNNKYYGKGKSPMTEYKIPAQQGMQTHLKRIADEVAKEDQHYRKDYALNLQHELDKDTPPLPVYNLDPSSKSRRAYNNNRKASVTHPLDLPSSSSQVEGSKKTTNPYDVHTHLSMINVNRTKENSNEGGREKERSNGKRPSVGWGSTPNATFS